MVLSSGIRALFVYGTLLSGYAPTGPEALKPPDTLQTAKLLGAATLRGFEMRNLGLYPCIVPSADGTIVGEVYEIADEAQWTILDEYEGISAELEKPYEYRREVGVSHSALALVRALPGCSSFCPLWI